MSQYIKTEYIKFRKNFGRQPLFQAVPGHIIDSIFPNKADQKNYILRNPVNRSIQATLPQSVNESNTPSIEIHEQGINHSEGGWPKDVHIYNEDHVNRHRRRIMHEENFVNAVLNLAPTLTHCVDQNNAIELYETYFTGISPLEPVETPSIRIANVFRDVHKRPISSIKWTNEKQPMLAVSYCFKTWSAEKVDNFFNNCYLWDINRQTDPAHEIHPEYPCWQLACSPVTPEIILCGLENGTVSLFDIREGMQAVSSSSVFNSHRDPITSIRYIYSKTHSEFFTGSVDGQCLWWDMRNISAPLDQLPMSVRLQTKETPNLGNSESVSSLEYDYLLPTKFLCGSDSGLVINANRMGKSHSEILTNYWSAHDGPVRSIERSKCTSRMFLTCGDYTVKIWSEEVRSGPIIVGRPYKYSVCDAAWAPLKFSCYMSICADGKFYYWDLLRKQKKPITTLQVSKDELTKLTPHVDGESVAIGDNQGAVHLLNLSENMVVPGPRDKPLMFQIYERETKREHILENRIKELRLKALEEKQLEAMKETSSETVSEEDHDRAVEDKYFSIVNEQIKLMGITSEETGIN